MIRATGLTAAKFTLGGDGDRTGVEVDAFHRTVADNPDVHLKVKEYADLQRAHDTKRVGLIYSFEASEMLEPCVPDGRSGSLSIRT